MLLQRMTWPEVEAYLATRTDVILPLGSTEQHGPTGLIGTDAITAELIARQLGEAADAVVAPVLAYGMAEHHMAFPGTASLRSSTLIGVICDVVLSLARHGFTRFFFVNGHGGNIAPATAAFGEIHAALAASARPGVRCVLRNWWTVSEVARLRRELYGENEGAHATPSEIAVTWHAFPEERRSARLESAAKAAMRFHGADDFRRRFPDGRMGSDPSLAEPEHGARLVRAAIDALLRDYRSFLDED